MSGPSRRVYAPDLGEAPAQRSRPRARGGLTGFFVGVVIVASIALLWGLLVGVGAPPLVKAPSQPYKVAAEAPTQTAAPQPSLYEALEATSPGGAPAAAKPDQVAPSPEKPPGLQASGPYVVQLAALQSTESAAALKAKLTKADPDSFGKATFDIQRVETEKGVFFRVRAGYFADWAEASTFCKRLAPLKQDCIVVAR